MRRALPIAYCCVFALLTLVAISAGLQTLGQPFAGLWWEEHGDFSQVWAPWWGPQTTEVGYPAHLLAIDDVVLSPTETAKEARRVLAAATGRTVTLTFADRARGRVVLVKTLAKLQWRDFGFFVGVYALLAWLFVLSAVVVWQQSTRRPAAHAYVLFASGCALFMLSFYDFHTTMWFPWLLELSKVMFPLGMLWMSYAFPAPPRRFRRPLRALCLSAAVMISGVSVFVCTEPWHGIDTTDARIFTSMVPSAGALSLLVALIARLFHPERRMREQVRLMLVMLGLSPLLMVLFDVSTIFFHGLSLPLIVPLLATLSPLGLAYALVRENVLASLEPASQSWVVVPSLLLAAAITLVVRLAVSASENVAIFVALFFSLRFVLSRGLFSRLGTFQAAMRRVLDALSSARTYDDAVYALCSAATLWLRGRRVSYVRAAELAHVTHLPAEARTALAAGAWQHTQQPVWDRVLLMPLASAGELEGALRVAPSGRLFTRADFAFLSALADLGTLALRDRRAYDALRELRKGQARLAEQEKRVALSLVGGEVLHEVAYPVSYFRYLLKRGESGAWSSEDLTLGREELQRLERLLNGPLVKGLQTRAPAARERVSIAAVARRAVDVLIDVMEARAVTCSVDVPSEAQVSGNGDHLLQILCNLLRNGVESAREGGEVGIRYDDGVLSVWDSGPGVPSTLRASLFSPGVTTKPSGMGLGLVIARKLAASEGWSLELGADARTTFIVRMLA